MADQYGLFWNSVNSDRLYDADSFAEWLRKFFATGVFSGELQVTSAGGMDVSVSSGYANINGKVRFFDSATKLTLATAGATYPRIDTIVVERNDTDRQITIKAITGTYSASPTATAPVRANNVYQIVLAQIYVAAGATVITQAAITDTRSDNSICGIVTGTVKEMDYSQFAAQFNSYYSNFKISNKADFDAWFNQMKNQLTTDAAGKLQTEINNLQAGGRNLITNSKGEFSGSYPSERFYDVVQPVDVPIPTDATHFVLSFNAKSTADGDKAQSYFFNPSDISKTEVSSASMRTENNNMGFVETSLTTEWKRYWIKWTAPVADTRTLIVMRLGAGYGTGQVSLRNIKFEIGTIPTDWTPAPEDVENEIKALNSVTKNFTLSASSWIVYEDHWLYEVQDSLITATSNQEIIPAPVITADQLKALQKANLVCDSQTAGKLHLRVFGAKPTIDIPITVIFRGKI